MNTNLGRTPEWQRQKAQKLDEICRALKQQVAQGVPIKQSAKAVCNTFAGTVLDDVGGAVRTLALSGSGLLRHYYKWCKADERYDVFLPSYTRQAARVPEELITELRRRCSLPGIVNSSVVIKAFQREWEAGKEMPGMGSWQNWWAAEYPGIPLPERAPEFPISERTLYRYAPRGAHRVWGNRGIAVARKALPWVSRDYSQLRPGELFIFDDCRLDILAMDDKTRRPTELNCYLAIEGGTRLIPCHVMRAANAMKKTDVDTLVIRSLKMIGIGADYPTHLYFERGTLTMSSDAAKVLEQVSEGRIKVHWTSMNTARTHAGAFRDDPVGHWMGKAVIESFVRKLHLALMTIPGQRGNNYARQPASLGWVGQGQRPVSGTLAAESERLAEIQMAFGTRLKLNFGILWASEVNAVIRQAITLHNNSRDHEYQGFTKISQEETAPGIWKDICA